MKIKQKAEGDVMVLHLSGKIMGGPDHEKFHSEVKTLIKEGYVDVLLNMSKVSWINSTGLGVLVSAFHTLKKNGGQLKICEVSRLSPAAGSLLPDGPRAGTGARR